MARISKTVLAELNEILTRIDTGLLFIDSPLITVARVSSRGASTTLDFTRERDNRTLTEIDKEIGSDLTAIRNARRRLKQLIDSAQ